MERALSAIRAGNNEEGLAILTELARRPESRREALGHRAWLYRSTQRFDEAIQDLDALLRENPSDLYAAAIRAETLLLSNKLNEAVIAAARVLEAEPTHATAFRVLMRCGTVLGMRTQSEDGESHDATENYFLNGKTDLDECRAAIGKLIPRFLTPRIAMDYFRFRSRYAYYEHYLRTHAKNKRVIDIGAMWLVDGRFSFFAEDCGASEVIAFDVMDPSVNFLAEVARRNSRVKYIQGDLMEEGIERLGKFDVVFCCGVLYHVPDPAMAVQRLKSLSRERALIGTAVIGEGLMRNRAVYYPYMGPLSRAYWNFRSDQTKLALDTAYNPALGYGNWFWGMSPSCFASLLFTHGFRLENIHYRPHYAFFECVAN